MADFSTSGVLEKLRSEAQEILAAALQAADPEVAVKRFLKIRGDQLTVMPDVHVDLSCFRRIFVVGAGKASAPMAKALEDILGQRLTGGIISVKYGHQLPLKKIRVREAGHPIPDEAGVQAGRAMLALLESVQAHDLVFSCLSGGGSALLSVPAEGITLHDKQLVTQRLLACGASIHEINAVRKHLSIVKGGGLMIAAYPALVLNLMLSDVVGDAPDVIASGPFSPDSSTFGTALEVLERYQLLDELPRCVVSHLERGAKGIIPETPKEDDRIFERVRHAVVGSNLLCLNAARSAAEALGYRTLVLSSRMEGDTEELARFHVALAHEIRNSGNPVPPPACLLSGGETTVAVKGSGKGGRNQHFALCLVQGASQIRDCVFLSVGTDGTDGPTEVAGAVVDTSSLHRAAARGLDPKQFLREYDSYHFFRVLGDLLITGPTRTNVMDVRVVLLA